LITAHGKAAAGVNEIISRGLFERDVSGLGERLLTSRNWKLYSREFPVLDVGFCAVGRPELRLRLVAKNWNEEPASVELLNSVGEFLAEAPQYPGSVFNNSAHPATSRPFVCMTGALEYHIHPSHVNDSWENYKNRAAYTLGAILTQLWNAWLKSTP
jgi:Predicted metal binding domain